jgi:hypothetical protein
MTCKHIYIYNFLVKSKFVISALNLFLQFFREIKSRRMRWAGHVARMGEKRNAYRILVGKPGGKRPLRRSRRRWMDNVKIELREMGLGWYGLDRSDLG